MTRKTLRENLKMRYLQKLIDFLNSNGEQVLRVGSNEIAFPVIDEEGNEDFITLKIVIPIGSRDGDIYDGYSMAEQYSLNEKKKAETAKEKEKNKAKKIVKDEKRRESEKKMKSKRE